MSRLVLLLCGLLIVAEMVAATHLGPGNSLVEKDETALHKICIYKEGMGSKSSSSLPKSSNSAACEPAAQSPSASTTSEQVATRAKRATSEALRLALEARSIARANSKRIQKVAKSFALAAYTLQGKQDVELLAKILEVKRA